MKSLLKCARAAGICALSALLSAAALHASEPHMAQYTHFPVFKTEKVEPRIMIVLDNSNSMNFPAYGQEDEDWPNGQTLPMVYDGQNCTEFSGRVNGTNDDGWERKDNGQIILCGVFDSRKQLDLPIGIDDDTYTGYTACNQKEALTAIRFSDVTVPRMVDGVPVVIKTAYIEFTARTNNGNNNFRRRALTLDITAQADDSPPDIGANLHNISSRPDTAATVRWDVPGGKASDEWISGSTYATPDLAPIVQELVSRPGWASGNAMLFKIDHIAGAGGRVAHSFDSNATLAPRLVIEYEPCEIKNYYGYFNSNMRYTYSSNMFVPDPAGQWCGNFLNFLSMRRGDVLLKAVVGGNSTSRTGGGNQTLIGISDSRTIASFRRHHAGAGVSPWGDAWYFMTGGKILVRPSDSWSASIHGDFNIRVDKDPAFDPPSDFGPDGELAGVLQKVGDKAQWGNAWFISGSDTSAGKATIDYPIGSNVNSMVTTIKNKAFDTATPLAEALYVVTQYFKQQDAEITGYPNNAIGPFNNIRDPFHDKDGVIEESCAQGFCLLLSDGMSTVDQRIPDYLKGYVHTLPPESDFPSSGSSYVRDVAYYMNTTDLRSETVGKDALPGFQNVRVYVIYALGNNSDARQLLQQTAKYGGFRDRNNNNYPDLQVEWDRSGNGIPDNYFEAREGEQLERELMNAILAIIADAGSGTAVSVLATKGEGEGTLVQALFEPSRVTDTGEVSWLGHLHSLWIDRDGQLREDSVNDYELNINEDQRIIFGKDETDQVVFWPYDNQGEQGDSKPMEALSSIWSAGDVLAEKDPIFRNIYTYRGNGTEADPQVNFVRVGSNFWTTLSIMHLLGINNDAEWAYLGTGSEAERAVNLLLWTIGVPDTDGQYYGAPRLRRRTLDDGRLWKMGDIIHSTPQSIAQPLSDFDLVYNDPSFLEYYKQYRDRETVIYVGTNAGKLHAISGWVFHEGRFENPYDVPDYFLKYTDSTAGNTAIGSELWAYIPQNLLPHLKWLAEPDYSHVNYIDLQPRVFDAKIFEPSARHPGGWGTIVVGGFGFAGGMPIPCNPNHPDPAKRLTMKPAFFALDVTDPRSPVFLWERSFPDLGMSSNYPSIIKVEDNWMLAIGSGPSSMNADSVHPASLIIVDLKTGGDVARGGLKKSFTLPGGNAFAGTPATVDKGLNYSVDAVYVAANYNTGASQLFRLTIPQKDRDAYARLGESGIRPEYVDDPADSRWKITKLLKSPRPITAPLALSIDRKDNVWLYMGTGKFLTLADKTNTDQNYIIAIKDPFFNPDRDACKYKYPPVECEINALGTADNPFNDLFDADAYTVYNRGTVEGPGEDDISFDDLVLEARRNVYSGWYRRLQRETGVPSERVINPGTVFGGLLLMPTFQPDSDPCRAGGSSRLFAVYYETGTAYFKRTFSQDSGDGPVMDVISLGEGIASSLSVHRGRQSEGSLTGGKVYVQKSTGEIMELNVDTPFNTKSHAVPTYWLDDGYY